VFRGDECCYNSGTSKEQLGGWDGVKEYQLFPRGHTTKELTQIYVENGN